jgi:hypothetical protein
MQTGVRQAALFRKRCAHQRHRGCQAPEHELGFHSQHSIAKPAQHGVPTRVGARAQPVTRAVDLHHEPHRRRAKVHDVAPRQRHLAPKLHAELSRLQRRPKPQLRRRHHAPIGPGALLQPKLLASEIVCFPITHLSLPRRRRAERSPQGAGFVPRPLLIQHAATGVARSVRPPAKLGPMPTREASRRSQDNAVRARGGRGVVPPKRTAHSARGRHRRR